MAMQNPVRGNVYTVTQIVRDLKLRDSPFLKMDITNPLGDKVDTVIQLAWIDDYEKLVPIMGDLKFKYIRETHEWIPIFQFTGTEEEFLNCVDVAVDLNPHLNDEDSVGMVVWPKGTEYEQYYKLSDDKLKLVDAYDSYPTPANILKALPATK